MLGWSAVDCHRQPLYGRFLAAFELFLRAELVQSMHAMSQRSRMVVAPMSRGAAGLRLHTQLT